MNGYDFDKTIYDGDSFTHFYLYSLIHRPYLILVVPFQLIACIIFGFKRKMIKRSFASFLIFSFKREKLVDGFWKTHHKNIKNWYYETQQSDDVIVSASPRFLLEPECKRLGIKTLISTDMNFKTGKIYGENCYGKEKPPRFKKVCGDIVLDSFYSDSMSDLPMMRLAKKSYLVDKNTIIELTEENVKNGTKPC